MHSNLIYIIAALIILFISLAIAVTIKQSKKRKKMMAEQHPEGPEFIPPGSEGEDLYEGRNFQYKHFKGADKAPPYFSISMECPSTGAFTITPETKFDRFFKNLGVCVEIQTHDPDFDNAFYINTNAVSFTRRLLEQPGNRGAIKNLFNLEFNHLEHNGQSITITWKNFPRKSPMQMATVQNALPHLAALSQNITDVHSADSADDSISPMWKIKRLAAFAIPTLLLVGGTVAMIAGFSEYRPLDGGKMFLNSLSFTIPAFILFTWFAIQLLKGRSSSHRELIIVFFIALLGVPLGGFGGQVYLNGALDHKPPSVHQVTLLRKYAKKNKNNYTYYAVIDSWRTNRDQESLRVSRSFYSQLTPGVSGMIITTKPGKYDYEWIVNIQAR